MLGAIIGAASSLAGGLLQKNAAKKANQAAENQQRQEYERQKEFAQSGIQWKVQDAEKAGIHPLYAVGAQTTSYQPTSVGGNLSTGDLGIPDAGQNIGRAIDATRSSPEQKAALALTATQIEGLNLDNELKRTQLASAVALAHQHQQVGIPGIGDVFNVPGQGNSGIVSGVPPGHDARLPQYTNPDLMLEGYRWERRPGTSDAQSWEDVYGDENAGLMLLRNFLFARDALHNTGKAYNKNIIDKLRR